MSSLDHDHLLDDGPEPRTRGGSPLAAAGGTRSRRHPAARTGEKASESAPKQRQGEAQHAGPTTTTRTTSRRRQSAGSTVDAPARRPRPTPRPRPAATPEPAPEVVVDAVAVTDVEDAGTLVAAGETSSRAVVEELCEAATPPAAVVVKEVVVKEAEVSAGRVARLRRVVRRRPALHLAAALVAALGTGAVSAGPAAQADPTEKPSHSMSVAAQLGLSAQETSAAPNAHDADRLAELAASRATREAEQTAAVRVQQEADRLAAEAIAEAQRPKAVLPVDGARLTSGFGFRWGTVHAGIDLAAPIGTPEYAAMDGVVLEAGPASGFGLGVYIQHENGDVTVYGHMDRILVGPGQVVKAGDTIALLGNRGQSTGPHLHFEVHVGGLGGEKIDPVPWLQERGVQI